MSRRCAAAKLSASTSTRSRRCATRAAAPFRRVLEAVRVVHRRRRAGHHRAPAGRRAAHHADGRARRSPRAAGRCAARSSSTSKATRGPTCSRSCDEVQPDQCTLVPVAPGEITSQAGWPPRHAARASCRRSSRVCSATAIRVSLFVDPDAGRRCGGPPRSGADRVELYTEPFARAFERGADAGAAQLSRGYADAAELAHALGLGVNAGHDLDLDNLRCSARCRISTKSRSATRSSAARCSSGSIARCANTSAALGA